eukprot:3111801-Ditylum_brightwellii.AAC.1
MSARLYDKWAEQCRIGRDQTVVAGTKRKRKKSSMYGVDDTANSAKPSTINSTINKRKTQEKSSEVGTDDEAPTNQPHTTTPASVAVLVD